MFCHQASAQEVVYENVDPSRYLSNALPIIGEVGDEVELGGTARIITGLQFEYYGYWIPQGDERVTVRFYKNDGPTVDAFDNSHSPKTLIWEGSLGLLSPGYQTRTFTNINKLVPSDFTIAFEFSGLANTTAEHAEILLYDPPTIGRSFGDYWQRTGPSTWGLDLTPPIRDNFALKLYAGVEGAIKVTKGASNLNLTWLGTGFVPQQSSDLIHWQNISGAAANFAVVPIGPGNMFFRLRRPPPGEMSITRTTTQVQISWIGTGYVLQENTVLGSTTGWVTIQTTGNSTSLPVDTTLNKFYRLLKSQ